MILGFVLGGVLLFAAGVALGRFMATRKANDVATEDRLEIQALVQEKRWLEEKAQMSQAKVDAAQATEQDLRRQVAVLSAQLESQTHFLEQSQKQLTDKFELLATQALERNRQAVTAASSESISQLLTPLKEKLQNFERRLEEDRLKEAKEMGVLQHEIRRLAELNSQMTQEAQNLTKALKGDVKTQGNWGEMVLEKILEASGLREGSEYTRQSAGMGLKGEDGEIQRPDIIVHLPENKHLIVDSKVSLVAYERWACESDETQRARWADQHVDSVLKHVRGLSEKEYHFNEQIITPDFVMMFVPIESAFSAALQFKPEIFQLAWDKKVVLVSPTTLLATLRTVDSIWRQEKQTRNALEIARVGGGLYDEFVRMMEDMQVVGTKIKEAQSAHESAVKRLAQGRGNLLNRVETLRELGARTKKQIPEALQPEL